MKNICAFTQGELSPSTRFRLSQYVPFFETAGYSVNFNHAKVSAFPPAEKIRRPYWFASEVMHRFKQVNSCKEKYSFIQREMISTLPTFERFVGGVKLFDVDDAIFLNRNGLAAKNIAKRVDAVICGNEFLAEYFYKYNNNVHIIPTAVDNKRFVPVASISQQKYIGWSGSSSGHVFLYTIQDQLRRFLECYPDFKLLISSDKCPVFSAIPNEKVEFRKWSVFTEVSDIQDMTIGIMPLDSNPWSLGKCSYKMLLYMACGIPCVVSAIGNNNDVLGKGLVGLGVSQVDRWTDALISLVTQPELMDSMASNAPLVVEKHYSVQSVSNQLLALFNEYYR